MIENDFQGKYIWGVLWVSSLAHILHWDKEFLICTAAQHQGASKNPFWGALCLYIYENISV